MHHLIFTLLLLCHFSTTNSVTSKNIIEIDGGIHKTNHWVEISIQISIEFKYSSSYDVFNKYSNDGGRCEISLEKLNHDNKIS